VPQLHKATERIAAAAVRDARRWLRRTGGEARESGVRCSQQKRLSFLKYDGLLTEDHTSRKLNSAIDDDRRPILSRAPIARRDLLMQSTANRAASFQN
jgi:hypothetical protein